MPLFLAVLKEWKLILLAIGLVYLATMFARIEHYRTKAEVAEARVETLERYKNTAIVANALEVERKKLQSSLDGFYKKLQRDIDKLPRETTNEKGCEYLDIPVDPELDKLLMVRPEIGRP